MADQPADPRHGGIDPDDIEVSMDKGILPGS